MERNWIPHVEREPIAGVIVPSDGGRPAGILLPIGERRGARLTETTPRTVTCNRQTGPT